MKLKKDMTRPQQKAMFARLNAGRTQGAINRDMSVRAAETLPFTDENVKTWRQNQRRIDIEGIDTPTPTRAFGHKSPVNETWSMNRTQARNLLTDANMDLHRRAVREALDVGLTPYKGWQKDYPELVKDTNTHDKRLPEKKAELNTSKSKYEDLIKISDGDYNGRRMDQETSKDADKLFKAIQSEDIDTIRTIQSKYHLVRSRSIKQGEARVRMNVGEITIHDIALHAREEIEESRTKNGAPSAQDKKQKQAPQTKDFKPDESLLNKELLRNAHAGTSFDPEKRAETEKEYFKAEVNDVHKQLKGQAKTDKQKAELKDEMAKFQKKYAEKYNDLLASRGRMLSPMITGPANFPTRRNEKAYNSYENKRQANETFRQKVVAGIGKRWRKENIADAGGERAVLEKKLKKDQENHQQMKDINKIMRKKTSDSDKRKQMENIGVSENLIRDVFKPGYMGRTGFQGFHLQNSNARIKSAKERLALMDKQDATKTTSGTINGVEVVDNTEDNRIQLFFDGKPDDDMRKKLKGSGWRWAPSVGAWQRIRTNNAMDSAKRILSSNIKKPTCEPDSECNELRLTQKLQEME